MKISPLGFVIFWNDNAFDDSSLLLIERVESWHLNSQYIVKLGVIQMQQDNMNNNDLAVEKTLKAAWSKPEIEVIDIGSTDGKTFTGAEDSITTGS